MDKITGVESSEKLPQNHPIYILKEEHKALLEFAQKLIKVQSDLKKEDILNPQTEKIKLLTHIIEHLKESEKHYLREENVLFPYLEKHGITQPPKVMWMEHDEIRKIKKNIYRLFEEKESISFAEFSKNFSESTLQLSEMLHSHFEKENHILFPTSLRLFEENEWKDIKREFDEIGYCCFTPETAREPSEETKETPSPKFESEGRITFETGSLSPHEIESIFNTLPVDITFVDKDDVVRYFSQTKERIFVRTKAVIGRKVQQCHPQKSIHLVNKILDDFKAGVRDRAEFWINLKERLIYIQYFAVRDRKGEYLGCLEVTQDITEVKKIEGEKRLLD
jgi:hypothetical protein